LEFDGLAKLSQQVFSWVIAIGRLTVITIFNIGTTLRQMEPIGWASAY
jgi:hypothetical protein